VLVGFTFFAGLFVAPSLFLAQYLASRGGTLDASPVRDAFLLAAAAFVGLTSYVLVARRDFSFLRAGLSMGLWVVIGASLLGVLLRSTTLGLAVASAGVLLFCGFILFDTSRLLRATDERDPVGAALRLFLDVMNLFLFLVRILSSPRAR
jgi:FtsH-binding integral membrane protein